MKYDEQVHHTLWVLSFFFFLIVLPWFGHVLSNKGRFGHKRKLPGFFTSSCFFLEKGKSPQKPGDPGKFPMKTP